ncbi:MAG: hypothetical protein ACRDJU_05965 [Actinomycetota bacterium]
MSDPQVPVEEAVAFLLEFHEGRGCRIPLAALVARDSSIERMAELAAHAVKSAPESPTALSFGAQASCYQADQATALSLIESALVTTGRGDATLCITWIAVLLESGRIADAIDEIDRFSREQPDLHDYQALRMGALAEAARRAARAPAQDCPCGSRASFAACCGPREAEALRRFADRRRWDDLRVAVLDHAGQTEGLVDAILDTWTEAQEDWLGEVALDPSDPELTLALDWGLTWIAPEDAWEVPDEPGGSVSALESFVASQVDGDDGGDALAHQWLAHHRFGAWQVGPLQEGPGLGLTDLLTGLRVYADVPSAAAVNDPWAVLLGLMVCDEGIWRAGGGLVVLSPSEADSLVARALRLAEEAARRSPGYRDRIRDLHKLPRDIPPGLLAERELLTDRIGELLYLGAVSHLPELAASVRTQRRAQVNSDDEPIELIEATITPSNLVRMRAALRARPDIAPNGHGDLAWTVNRLKADPLRPTLRSPKDSALHAAPIEEGDLVALATLTIHPRRLRALVNSRTRFERLVAMLESIDPAVSIVEEWAEIPGHTAVWERDAGGATEEEVMAWEQAWPDLPLWSLDGLTPRRAATLPQVAPKLELALRELEFQAALTRRAGHPAPDLTTLRAAMGMATHRGTPMVADEASAPPTPVPDSGGAAKAGDEKP